MRPEKKLQNRLKNQQKSKTMIQEIVGEQRFQLISGSFAVTPPQNDYKLMYSIDGIAFYEYASYVGGTPLVVTNAIPGLWFMLMGNRGVVQLMM